MHPKGESIFWTSVKYNIFDEKEDYKDIILRGFGSKLFESEEGGGVREVLDGYHYLKHIIQFWVGDWFKHMENINEMVGMKNHLLMSGIKKRLRLARTFTRQELWKCIGCILPAVTYGNKGHKLWS